MKKILSILSTLTLTGSAAIVLTSSVDNHVQQTKNETKTNIDWNDIKSQTSEYFKNLKSEQKNQKIFYTTEDKQISSEEAIQYAQEKALEYITRFQNQNLNSNQITNILLNENSDFKENYNNILQEQTQNNNTTKVSIQNLKALDITWDQYERIQEKMPQTRKDATIFSSISIAAAIAAAGFYAVAWFFGISLPWAIGCTVISVATSFIATEINITLYLYDQTESYLQRQIQEINILYDLINDVKNSLSTLKNLLMGEELVIATSDWAFTPASVLIPIIFYILSFIK